MMTPARLAAELERRLDGPHADEHTAGAAHLCAEAVRFLNYATGSHSPEGLVYPATAYTAVADLSSATYRMRQLFGQLADWLATEHHAGHLAMDDHGEVGVIVASARIRLGTAAGLAGQLSRELADLQSAISGLNGRGPAQAGGA